MYSKLGQMLLKDELAFLYHKAGQVVLHSKTGITKLGYFYYKVGKVLQSGAFITN